MNGHCPNRPAVLRHERCSGNRARAFTLIELLSVMGLIVVLLGLMVSSFKGTSQSYALTGGGDTVTGLVALARQTATSKNTMTALVLLGAQNPATAGDYRAFTVIQYNVTRKAWSQITPWQTLPTGILVDAGHTAQCTFLLNSPTSFPPTNASTPINPVVYNGKTVNAFAARIFLPNGTLINAQDAANIRLVEGMWQGTQITYTHPVPGANKPANYYDIAILGATGQTKVGRP